MHAKILFAVHADDFVVYCTEDNILYTIYSLGYTTEVDNLTLHGLYRERHPCMHAPDKHCPRNSYTAASVQPAGMHASKACMHGQR